MRRLLFIQFAVVTTLVLVSACTNSLEGDPAATETPIPTPIIIPTGLPTAPAQPQPTNTPPTLIITPTIVTEVEVGAGFDSVMKSPDDVWHAKGRVEMKGSEAGVEFIIENSKDAFPLIAEVREVNQGFTRPHLLGWTPNSRYFYFAETGNSDGCGDLTYFSKLSRFDTQMGEVELLLEGVVASVAFSPDGSRLALKPLPEGQSGDIQVWGTDSAEIISTIPLVDNVYEQGNLLTKLAWSNDGSLLVAELHTAWCPVFNEEVAFQIGDEIVFSSNDVVLDKYPVIDFEVVALSSMTLSVRDVISGCEYVVDLNTNKVASDNCVERVVVAPHPQPHNPAVSPNGEWGAIIEINENRANSSFDVSAVVRTKKEAGIQHTLVDESREGRYGGISNPIALGWSADSRYFFYSERWFPDGCDADLSIYGDLRRLDVTTGDIDFIYEMEMASVTLSYDGQKLAYMPRPYSGDEYMALSILDLASLEPISDHRLNVKYVSGATTNKLHWSADSQSVIAELHTTWCPILDGNIDFWKIDLRDENDLTNDDLDPLFSSSEIKGNDIRLAFLGFDQFVEGVLQVSEAETACVFTISAETHTITSPNCPDRISK